MAVSANRLELLQIADAVAREKAIDRGIVITAMEDAIAKAARSRYGAETDVHAEIEPKTGDLRLTRHMLVVESVENPSNQITLEEARKRHPAAQVGDTIADPLPPLEYGRIAAQSAKQVIVQKVREAERDRQYAEYKDRIGDVVNGIVTNCCRAKFSATATASAPISTMYGESRAARRFSCRARIRNSLPNCSRRKCRKFMTASLKSRRSHEIPDRAPR
jgi:hypothetical protein